MGSSPHPAQPCREVLNPKHSKAQKAHKEPPGVGAVFGVGTSCRAEALSSTQLQNTYIQIISLAVLAAYGVKTKRERRK